MKDLFPKGVQLMGKLMRRFKIQIVSPWKTGEKCKKCINSRYLSSKQLCFLDVMVFQRMLTAYTAFAQATSRKLTKLTWDLGEASEGFFFISKPQSNLHFTYKPVYYTVWSVFFSSDLKDWHLCLGVRIDMGMTFPAIL